MRVLIVGSSGFVGPYLAAHLHAAGDEVWGTTSGRHGSQAGAIRKAIESSGRGRDCQRTTSIAQELAWDIGTEDRPQAAVGRALADFAPECIYLLAALSVPALCGQTDPTPQAQAVNVDGVRRVVDWMLQLAVPPRLVFASSSHVYGPSSAERPPFAEDAPLAPCNGYGKTKLAAEEVIRAASRERGLRAAIVRAFNHTGPGQQPPLLLPEWIMQFVPPATGPVQVRNLSTTLDLSDVRDIVRAYRLFGQRDDPGTAFNLGSGRPTTTRQILELLMAASGQKRAVEETRPGPRWEPIADLRQTHSAIGWAAEIPLSQTITDTLAAACSASAQHEKSST